MNETEDYPTHEELERIEDAAFGTPTAGVRITDIFQHNACNHTISGTVERDGKMFGFIIESGDWNGTVVRSWGDPEDVGSFEHPKPSEPLTFVPNDRNLAINMPGIFITYLQLRKTSWFKEKESGYNYDRHFQPGSQTESHYRKWAESKGMTIGLFSDLLSIPEAAKLIKENA